MPYVKLLGTSAGAKAPPAGMAGCGCSAPRLLPSAEGIGLRGAYPLRGPGLGFDLESFGAGSGTVIAGLALLIGGLLLFGPGARERSSKLKDENRRHREAVSDENKRHRSELSSIKSRYTRLPRAVTYDREVY